MHEISKETYTPAEFAALYNRSYSWGYRRIYDGSVKVLAAAPCLTIPRAEVEAFACKTVFHEQSRKTHSRSLPARKTGTTKNFKSGKSRPAPLGLSSSSDADAALVPAELRRREKPTES